ncbi:hypothetical protein [Massilia sp. DWR3-1-1]|uniref:hypothetical protein n=1 Tax=Massilia sp. DWR3-1-1 TaxID=2804559 RepID=UPI003CFAB0C4
MQAILSAVFDNRRDAEAAIDELLLAGFRRSAIHLGTGDPTGADSPLTGNGGPATGAPAPGEGGVGNFLHTLFGTDNSEFVQQIDGAVTHSHLVLTVLAAPATLAGAVDIAVRHRPVRLETRTPASGAPTQLQDQPPGGDARAAPEQASWRRHHADSHGDDDPHYDEYAPAYLYGLDMASHEQHGGKEWDEAEPALRSHWQGLYPHAAWSTFKDAVRHGWQRLRKPGKD